MEVAVHEAERLLFPTGKRELFQEAIGSAAGGVIYGRLHVAIAVG